MAAYTTCASEKDLAGILELERANLAANLTADELQSQGFVTVVHSFGSLKKLNDIEQHVIAKDNDKVIAYVLDMTAASKLDVTVIVPMFEMFEKTLYQNKLISS